MHVTIVTVSVKPEKVEAFKEACRLNHENSPQMIRQSLYFTKPIKPSKMPPRIKKLRIIWYGGILWRIGWLNPAKASPIKACIRS